MDFSSDEFFSMNAEELGRYLVQQKIRKNAVFLNSFLPPLTFLCGKFKISDYFEEETRESKFILRGIKSLREKLKR